MVSLRTNKISPIDTNTFGSAKKLTYLDISDDPLNCDDNHHLLTLPRLRKLRASPRVGSKCVKFLRRLWKKRVIHHIQLDSNTIQQNSAVSIITYIGICDPKLQFYYSFVLKFWRNIGLAKRDNLILEA